MGKLTKKIHRQDKNVIMMPPRLGPSDIPTETIAPEIPKALPRSDGGNDSVTIAIPNAIINAEPIACKTLKAISQCTDGASPHNTDPVVKTIKPPM